MILFENVRKSFLINKVYKHVVNNVSFSIPKGSIFGLVGESGTGKTTLLKLLLGLEKPESGSIYVDGHNILSSQNLHYFREHSAVVFQDANVLHNKSVYQNVALPLKLKGTEDPIAVMEALDFVGLKEHKDQFPRTLSGGEKQRLSIARALVTKPKIIICDEPTAALDYKSSIKVQDLLKQVNQKYGTTILIVSHDLEFTRNICHQIAFMENGEIKKIYPTPPTQNISHDTYAQYVEEKLR